ncbi:MAG TPA: CPBP family intramembrane glutamic endopeptidase [Anaerolineales bacterium]|nr:CPBP family intramembrane glutamic endopeptidase [Anaerolineales bacterium]
MATLNPPARSSIISSSSPDIKPLPLGPAVLFFAVPSLAVTIAYYWGIPAMVEWGLSQFAAYMVATMTPLAGCLVAAVVAYRLEGRPLTWAAFADRLRLRPMTRNDWIWSLGGFLFTLIGFAVMDVAGTLISRGWISLPASLPPALNPLMRSVADYRELMGSGAVGNWNLVVLVLAVLFFNVMGEELYFRGYIMPRQELVHGPRTWMVHFVLWTLFHVFIYWQWLYIMTVTLPVSYIAHRQRNTWTGIIIHGLHNAVDMSLLILIILGILV